MNDSLHPTPPLPTCPIAQVKLVVPSPGAQFGRRGTTLSGAEATGYARWTPGYAQGRGAWGAGDGGSRDAGGTSAASTAEAVAEDSIPPPPPPDEGEETIDEREFAMDDTPAPPSLAMDDTPAPPSLAHDGHTACRSTVLTLVLDLAPRRLETSHLNNFPLPPPRPLDHAPQSWRRGNGGQTWHTDATGGGGCTRGHPNTQMRRPCRRQATRCVYHRSW